MLLFQSQDMFFLEDHPHLEDTEKINFQVAIFKSLADIGFNKEIILGPVFF